MTSTKSKLYESVVKFVEESFDPKKTHTVKHLKHTVSWLHKIYPEADEAMMIAAVSHDIERASRGPASPGIPLPKDFLDPIYLAHHQQRGAEMMQVFLVEHKASPELVQRVHSLILHHEVGGSDEQNYIMDADSLSFLEVQVDHFLSDLLKVDGKAAIKAKFDWMYERIAHDNAKKLAKPLYDKAIKRLKAHK